ncbi:MAG: carboxypeptidase-like regulatory domain-containing protein [Bacteroidales bacterium]|nr:carboxypeptidase-like regulatory domain-containing protein [Bacteroidales bacterium]
MKSLLSILLCLCSLSLFSQHYHVAGKVVDAKNRQPIAFVNIVVNDGRFGGMSDIDGKYEINATEPVKTVRFSCLGYIPVEKTLGTGDTRLNVSLQPTSFELGEVTIEAGENPAHRIIDSVMAHRKENNPNALDSYRYHIYDQMVFTVDSTAPFFDSLFQNSDLMIMETYSEVLYRSPDQLRQNVLGTKMSGSKNAQVVYLASKMQSSSFYDETVNVAGTDYVNPISRNSKNHYFFTLETVSPAGNADSLYVISFHPMRGSTFKGLRGTMTIHSDGWALQNVKAAPNDEGNVFKINIQQLYQKIDGQWFPKQLNTNLVFPGIQAAVDGSAYPMVAIGKSYVSDVELHPALSKRSFSEIEVMVHEDAAYRDDAFWTQHRIDSLTERILNTYHLMDSLTRGNDIFDRMLNFTNKLMEESTIGVGPVDLDIGRMLKLSMFRGWYFGLHLSTNDRLSRHFRISGFGGYWTKLHDFDYGGEAKWLIARQRQMELGVRYAHKSTAIGEFSGFGDGGSILSENNYRFTFYENVLTRGNYTEVFYNTRFARHFKAFLTLGSYQKNYYLQPFDTLPTARFTTAEVKLRFAFREKFVSTTSGIQSYGTDYPVIWLSYQRSIKGFWGGEYGFERIKFQLEKDFQTRYVGKSSVLLQAGYASKSCPMMETFTPIASYEPFGLYSPGSFATMREGEFFSDRFVSLFLCHDFQGRLWSPRTEWFKPQLSLVTNAGWGAPDMVHGYFESGLVIKGLLNMPLVSMGAGIFYRYGYYSYTRTIENFAYKYSITFSL